MVITSIWKDLGYVAVLYLGGLQSIAETYYEAARIDGASRWQRLRYITLPMLTPTMFFIVIMLLINSFQVFDQFWLMPMRDSAAARQVQVIVTEVVRERLQLQPNGLRLGDVVGAVRPDLHHHVRAAPAAETVGLL